FPAFSLAKASSGESFVAERLGEMAALAPSRPTEAMPAVVNERNLRRVDASHFKHMTRSSLGINSIRAAWLYVRSEGGRWSARFGPDRPLFRRLLDPEPGNVEGRQKQQCQERRHD